MADHATNEQINFEKAKKDEDGLVPAIGNYVLLLELGNEWSSINLLFISSFEFPVQRGAMDVRFTTVGGLLTEMCDRLKGKTYGLGSEEECSDSRPEGDEQA